jgi:hypothetical protein
MLELKQHRCLTRQIHSLLAYELLVDAINQRATSYHLLQFNIP